MKLLAQLKNPVLPTPLGGGTVGPDTYKTAGGESVGKLIGSLVGAIFIFSFLFAFVYLLLGAFNWITSGGDKAKLESARDMITQAVIGIIIVAAAWAIMKLVGQFVGIDLGTDSIKLPIPTIE